LEKYMDNLFDLQDFQNIGIVSTSGLELLEETLKLPYKQKVLTVAFLWRWWTSGIPLEMVDREEQGQ
jgi:hypothetical protein